MSSIAKAAVFSFVLLLLLGGATYFIVFGEKHRSETEKPAAETVAQRAEGQKGPAPKAPAYENLPHLPAPGEISFTVRVLDQSTHRPLPKATLLVQRFTDGDRPGEKMFESGRRVGAATGEFTVSLPPGVYMARAQCPAYSAATKQVTLVKDKPAEVVVLELGHGNSISGRILTREGRGIGGARVLAYPQIGNPRASMIERLIKIVDIQEDAGKAPAETVSADDGSYQIDGLDKRYYTVKAIAASFSPSERSEIYPPQDGVDLKLPAGGVVPGAVTEPGGGGVEGAKVMAYTHVDSSDLFSIIETRARPPFETVTTGPGGQFRFETLGAGTYNFVVTAKGYQEGKFLKIRVHEGDNKQQLFAIQRGLSITGSVVSAAGEPIPGAKVRATRIGDAGRSEQIFIKFEDGSIPTDAQGKFSFDTLEPGKYTLLAWHPNYASEQKRDVDAPTEEVTITLPDGGAIAGTLSEAGSRSPIAGARISVTDMQDLRKEAISDEKGYYMVSGLNVGGQGKRYMNIHAEGYARLSNLQVHVEDGKLADGQNFELTRTSMVSGRVINTQGQGVAGARVMAKRKGANTPVPLTVGSAVTGDDGRYQIKDLEGGEETSLTVMTSDYLEKQGDPFSVQPGQSMELPDVVLKLGGMVQGVVVGPDGRGIAGVQVSVRLEGQTTPDVSLGASSDARGAFHLRGLSEGTVELVAKSNHFLEETVTGVKVAEGLITKDVRIALKQGSQVKGLVVDSEGRPVRDAQVTAHDISESGLKELRTETDQEGRFVVENVLSQESIELAVEHPDYGAWSSEKVAVGAEELKVVMPRMGGVRALVLDPQGNPVSSFSVQPQPKEGGEAAKKRLSVKNYQASGANRDGSFEYTGIPPGVYDIYVRNPSYSAFAFRDVEVNGQLLDLGKATLQEGGTLSGQVIDQNGRPLPGASVRVLGGMVKFNAAAFSPGRPAGDQSIAATDSRGLFEFKNLKGGAVSLQASLKGYVTQRVDDLDPNIAEKARDLKVRLELGAEVFGTVTDSGGNAKNGVSVYLTGVGDTANASDSNQRTATNSEGRFHFVGLTPGTYRVTAQRLGADAGQNQSTDPFTIAAGEQQEVQLLFD